MVAPPGREALLQQHETLERVVPPSLDSGGRMTEMCSGSEVGSYSRLIDFGITEL